jgi:hypothetical protein
VRRTNFFRLGTTARGWEVWSCCRLAVANFYGCLLKRLTLTTASPLSLRMKTFCSRLPSVLRFPGISAKLVRICEITGNFHRCNIFLDYFANSCERGVWYGGNVRGGPKPSRCGLGKYQKLLLTTGGTGQHGELILPVFTVDHAFDSVPQVENVEID